MTGVSPVRAALIGFGILALLIAANLWAFRALADTNYLVWYLKNGSAVALGASFLALVWDGLDLHEDLLSAHPLKYWRGCFALVGVLFYATGAHLRSPLQGTKGNDDDLGSAVGILFDGMASVLIMILIWLVVIGWLLVVAPLNYVVTLISGVLARQELRGQAWRPTIVPQGPILRLQSLPAGDPLPDNAVDVSLARKPFAITQAITSLLLWIAGFALPLIR